MRRRHFVLAAGTALLGGCASDSSTDGDPDGHAPAESDSTDLSGSGATGSTTPPATTVDCREPPSPPADPTRDSAREFVASHEAARIHNWLVAQHGGSGDCRPDGAGVEVRSSSARRVVEMSVEDAETAVTADTDAGFYVVSSCSGSARYWCPDERRACARAERNAHFVTHYVGDGEHVRVPDNWIACDVRDEPYRSPDAAENVAVPEDDPGMTFRIYDFLGGRAVDATLTHLGTGDEVLAETYEPPRGPSVQTNVTVRRGDYRLVASASDDRVAHEFSITSRDDPAWNGICVYLGPDADIHVVEVATSGDLAVPESGCFDRHGHQDNDD